MSFWLHLLAVAFFVVAPLMAIDFWVGVLLACVCLLAVEVIHGRFDDVWEAWHYDLEP